MSLENCARIQITRRIVLFMILFIIHIGQPIPSCFAAQVYPLTAPPVAAFYEHGQFDSHDISEDDLYASIQAAYDQESDFEKQQQLAERLLRLKWWRLWEANDEMKAETTIFSDSLQQYFHPDPEVQWTEPLSNPYHPEGEPERLHYRVHPNTSASHGIQGNFPFLLPVNGVLLQEVYFPEDVIPDSIELKIKTHYLLDPLHQPYTFQQVQWTQDAQTHFMTENRPDHFWAGTFSPDAPQKGEWRTLAVNLVDIGLNGRYRSIHGIEFHVSKGQVRFGRTLIRRPQVEIRGSQPYHIFSAGETLDFKLSVHNFSPYQQQYTLNLHISDYQGSPLQRIEQHFDLPEYASQQEAVTINPHGAHYLVLEYTLSQNGQPVQHGYSSAAILVPNTTKRKPSTKFGMMYWDQPGRDMVSLYEKLGVKLIVIFPEIQRLHLFDSQTFEVMPMLWALPERNPQEKTVLQHTLPAYLDANQRRFSNFWETDLRVPPEIFAPNMRAFSQIIKQAEPKALTGIGGLAWFNVAYLTKLLQEVDTSSSFFDFLCVMLYNTPSPPEYSGITEETEALTTLLQEHKATNVKIWNVEWSYYDALNLDGGFWFHAGVAQDYIAPYTIRQHLLGFAAGIDTMVPGTFIYAGRLPLAKNYGHSMTDGRNSIFRYDATPLPMTAAYSVLTRMLEGKAYQGQAKGHPNVQCQVYQAFDDSYLALESAETVLVVWSLFGYEDVTLKLFHDQIGSDRKVTILSMLGNKREQLIVNGEIHLTATPEPIYLLLDNATASLLDAQQITFSERLLRSAPQEVYRQTGEDSLFSLTYHIFNPYNHDIQGQLRLTHPHGITVVNTAIQYHNQVGKQIALNIVGESPSISPTVSMTEMIWLGRRHRVSVTFDVMIPQQMTRNAFYEQLAMGRQSDLPIEAEFLTGNQVLAHTMLPVQTYPPLQMRMRPFLLNKEASNTPIIRLRMENSSPIAREGRIHLKTSGYLDLAPEDMTFALQPGQIQEYDVQITGKKGAPKQYDHTMVDTRLQQHEAHVSIPSDQSERLDHYRRPAGYLSSFGIGEGYILEAIAQDQTGYETRQSRGYAFRPAVKATSAPVIDGYLDDWSDAVPLFVNPTGRLSGLTFFAKDYGGEMQWKGFDDFSAAWQMLWDEQFLYLAVKVYDDRFVPQYNLGHFWNGDSLSFQIDPRPEKADTSMITTPGDLRSIHTFNFGLRQDGPILFRKYPTHTYSTGIVNTARVAGRQVPEGVIYELALPWEELAPLHPRAGDWMGFSFVLYEDDGDGRETRLNWFGGSGGNGLAREPRLMGDIHFVE